MLRKLLAALMFTLAAVPVPGGGKEPDQGFDSDQGDRSSGGEVSVDVQGATPGLTPEVFRATLAAQGEWASSPRYGDVWRPHVPLGWRPYYNGDWLWSDEGWYWDSDEPFAWAVYHYGRWVSDPSWGWVWVPGYEWAPAWVAWRYGDEVVGWAPLAPGVSVYVTSYPFVDFWWTFVPTDRFVGYPVRTVAYGPRETGRWFRASAPAPARSQSPRVGGRSAPSPAWGGPSRAVVEERSGRPIEPVRRTWGGALPSERGRAPVLRSGPPQREPGRGSAPAAPPEWNRPPGRTDRGGAERPVVRPPSGEPRAPVRQPSGGGERRYERGRRER
jgi:hypothetical protein